LLSQIEIKESQTPAGNANPSATEAESRFRNGQTLYQNGNYGGALKELDDALRLSPQSAWAMKAQIYRAVCLEKLSRTQEAKDAMQALSGNPEVRTDTDLQLAYVELLYETGRPEDALKRVDDLIAAVPKAPMAYFWRAKVLLQLHRIDEAAKAAEESIRLLPDLPEAHNLLIRIYQMQGRSTEAAQQAEWVKDYERRMQAR
jgi:tetratricopeptide (TPR) repeat protein